MDLQRITCNPFYIWVQNIARHEWDLTEMSMTYKQIQKKIFNMFFMLNIKPFASFNNEQTQLLECSAICSTSDQISSS